ncbi:MAG: Panacea domain-containing protein [Pseudomonadota bacterium]
MTARRSSEAPRRTTLLPDAPEDRTAEVVIYVVGHTDSSQLGKTKLNKVMWHADVLHYRRYGKTITGQESYARLQNGPVPNGIYEVLRKLKDNGALAERHVPTPGGVRHELFNLVQPDPSWFDSAEVETLYEAMSFITRMSAKQASDNTHGPIWEELRNKEQMSIRAASVIPSEVRPEEIEMALENADAFKV